MKKQPARASTRAGSRLHSRCFHHRKTGELFIIYLPIRQIGDAGVARHRVVKGSVLLCHKRPAYIPRKRLRRQAKNRIFSSRRCVQKRTPSQGLALVPRYLVLPRVLCNHEIGGKSKNHPIPPRPGSTQPPIAARLARSST